MPRWLQICAILLAAAACSPPAPPPASVSVRDLDSAGEPQMRRIIVDGLIDAREWNRADTTEVLLPDGRTVQVLRQRGPDSIDFAFLGLGGNVARNIYPGILIDVTGNFPSQFGRDTWWFRMAPERCYARGIVEDLECGVQLTGFEASRYPRDRRDNLEMRISFALLEYNPTLTPEVALSVRFAEQALLVDAIWPLTAELRRPDTWARVDLSR